MKTRLLELQEKIYQQEIERNSELQPLTCSSKLYFFCCGEMCDLYFWGDGYDDDPDVKAMDLDEDSNLSYCTFLDFICRQENANKIGSLTFGGADVGANGTKNWDFSRIANSEVLFPNLSSFSVQLCDLGDHNLSIIAQYDYQENGLITNLLARMPMLDVLSLPSAPDDSFFKIGRHPLRMLAIQSGYDAQNFLENMADSDNFYQLKSFDFTDTGCYDSKKFIPFETYKKLFRSKAFSAVKHFTLRNSTLTHEQLFELQKMNPNVQFLYIDSKYGEYVSHMIKNETTKI